MRKPEKRWQLLFVADDGRIVPFKGFRGLIIGLASLLVIDIILCAGLGWQLARERAAYTRIGERLVAVQHHAARLRQDYERIAAELERTHVRPKPVGTAVPGSPQDASRAGREKDSATAPEHGLTALDATLADKPAVPAPERPTLAIASPSLGLDDQRQLLLVRLRIENKEPVSVPVEGRCVVVLKKPDTDPRTWISIPPVALTNGRPEGGEGQGFSVFQSVDMAIQAQAPKDPSAYTLAMVYLFDRKGDLLLQDSFPAALPSQPVPPEPNPPASPKPETDVPQAPSPVTLSDLSVTYDQAGQRFQARIKVRTTGYGKSPLTGTCVVVLKNERIPPGDWIALPDVALINGKPAAKGNHDFKVSNYVQLQLVRRGIKSHPGFQSAVVYIFDDAGGVVSEKTFPVDLPASK